MTAFAARCQSEEATDVLAKVKLRTQCMWVSAETCFSNVYGLVGFKRGCCKSCADNEDSSAGVCRLKAPAVSPDRRRPAGTQVSTRTLSATLTSIADL